MSKNYYSPIKHILIKYTVVVNDLSGKYIRLKCDVSKRKLGMVFVR
jgi:hypothetical protein